MIKTKVPIFVIISIFTTFSFCEETSDKKRLLQSGFRLSLLSLTTMLKFTYLKRIFIIIKKDTLSCDSTINLQCLLYRNHDLKLLWTPVFCIIWLLSSKKLSTHERSNLNLSQKTLPNLIRKFDQGQASL